MACSAPKGEEPNQRFPRSTPSRRLSLDDYAKNCSLTNGQCELANVRSCQFDEIVKNWTRTSNSSCMAAYGVSPVVVLVLIFSIEIIFRSIHNWITKFLRYQTCLLSVADKNGCCRGNWRADKGAHNNNL
ncbi:hypothetical protein OUZ56_029750 [Daphnia magna]|uniref:Uncharacterized protein n=2 Tax=Daphnia magna TaxID=35525 RepID=A0ABR0B7R1_9CRUS|nr:hypothetical protein OUZ56_029750 [Daphnia magna]